MWVFWTSLNFESIKPSNSPSNQSRKLDFFTSPQTHHNMTICGLSFHHGNTESRKNFEQKFFFQLGTLYLPGINKRLSSINLFTNSCHHISTNGKAPPYPHNNQQHPQFLYPWLAPDVMAAMLVHWSLKKKFGNSSLFLCKMQATFFFCFVHQHGRLITWMQTKNSLWRRANARIKCQLSKSFTVVIRPLSTLLIKPVSDHVWLTI